MSPFSRDETIVISDTHCWALPADVIFCIRNVLGRDSKDKRGRGFTGEKAVRLGLVKVSSAAGKVSFTGFRIARHTTLCEPCMQVEKVVLALAK
jgi:hypothetical protein